MSENPIGSITFTPPTFRAYEAPLGWLTHDQACHALWYYYITALNNYLEHIDDPIVLEGDPDVEPDFRQLFTSIATMYGVQPEQMVKFWRNVDLQCTIMALTKLPMNDKYRFDKTPEIRTQ